MRYYLSLLAAFFACHPMVFGDVELRVSIKVILGPRGEWPDNTDTVGDTGANLNSEQALRDNSDFANAILARHATGYRLVLRNNEVNTLSGFDPYWFSLPARDEGNRNELDASARAAKVVWKWHDDAINIYLNDSRSGICSFPDDPVQVIFIGAGSYREWIIHEFGHFVNLKHTHPLADDDGVDDWGDGDSLSETLDDDKDATTADINNRYDGNPLPRQPQEVRNDLIFNIMSYHLPQDRWVWQQRERVVEAFNDARSFVAIGRARFVQTDGNNGANGLTVANRLRTIGHAVSVSNTVNDVVLIRSGNYNANTEGLPVVMNKPLTLSAWRGPVRISR